MASNTLRRGPRREEELGRIEGCALMLDGEARLLAVLRRGELVRLRWGDVDLEKGVLLVENTKAWRRDDLPLHPRLLEELSRARPTHALPAARVFPTAPTTQTVRRDLERAGIPAEDEANRRADFHALRTTFGTKLTRAGCSSEEVRRLLRHRDVRTSMRFYTRLRIEDDARALARRESPLAALGSAREAVGETSVQCPHSEHETARNRATNGGETFAGPTGTEARKSSSGETLRPNTTKELEQFTGPESATFSVGC